MLSGRGDQQKATLVPVDLGASASSEPCTATSFTNHNIPFLSRYLIHSIGIAQTQTMEGHKQRAAPAEATGFQEETGKTMFEERSAPAHPQPSKRSVWDFNAQPNQLAGKGGQLVNSFHQQALRFQVEPPALVEYSNSTGTVIPCRPATVASADGPSTAKLSMAGQRLSQPIAISWHQVKSLDLFQQALQGDPQEQESLEQLQRSEQVGPAKSGRRYVRQDGSLVLAPFKAGDLDKDQLAATYRCCLASRSGSICSRPVRTRAGKLLL